jgi:hypothetical protein
MNTRASIAALAIGAVLVSVPALAQQRNPNDGGLVNLPAGAKLDGGSKATTSSNTYYGRAANDGGPGPQPTAAQMNAASAQNKTANQAPSQPHVGRPQNDGGM